MPAIVLVVACAAAYLHGAFELDGTLLASQYVKKALTLESLLKNTGFLLTYYGLVTKGELSLRLCSLLATSCSYSTNWLKWPDLNMAAIALQSGLLFRAGKLTWAVWRKTREITFTKREQNLYQTHFEPHGLSKREVRRHRSNAEAVPPVPPCLPRCQSRAPARSDWPLAADPDLILAARIPGHSTSSCYGRARSGGTGARPTTRN